MLYTIAMLTISKTKKHPGKLFTIILVSIVGVVFLLATSASSFSIGLEPENGTLQNTIRYTNDPSASNGSYIQFNQKDTISYSTEQKSVGPLANEGNIASNGSWYWGSQINDNGTNKYSITMRVPNSSTGSNNYFWSSSFVWTNDRAHGGYIGLQTRVDPLPSKAKGVIFSIWNTATAEAVSGGVARPFGGEGVGMQTARGYNWLTNTDYDMTIELDTSRSTATYNWWTGYITDLTTNIKTEIGRIQTPTSWGLMYPNNTFLERYGLISNKCGQIMPVGGIFTNLRARTSSGSTLNPTAVKVEIRNYSDCSNVFSAQSLDNGYHIQVNAGTSQ